MSKSHIFVKSFQTITQKNLTISVAESCTGGLIGDLLTNVPGSSNYYQGGVVVYSNESKINLLKVKPETLDRYGAVSDQTVREMAAGVRKRFQTDIGLAVTGIAGPGGVRINIAGCLDRCEEGPVIVVYPEGVWYSYIDQEDVDEIIEEHLLQGRIVERLKI